VFKSIIDIVKSAADTANDTALSTNFVIFTAFPPFYLK